MNIKKDENGRPTIAGILNSDGVTITPIQADPNNHTLNTSDGSSGSDNGNNSGNALLDDNGTPVLTVLSNAGDGTIIELYVDSSGNLLTKST